MKKEKIEKLMSSTKSGSQVTKEFKKYAEESVVPDNKQAMEYSDIYGHCGWMFRATKYGVTDTVLVGVGFGEPTITKEDAKQKALRGLSFFFQSPKEIKQIINIAEKYRSVDIDGAGESAGNLIFFDRYSTDKKVYKCKFCGAELSMDEHMSMMFSGHCKNCK